MASERGRESRKRYLLERVPAAVTNVLRGAARAGGKVIADEAKRLARSDEVRDGIQVRTKVDGYTIRVWVTVKPGWPRAVGIWLEYGTAPHFITVDASQSQGMTAARINRLGKAGTLVINGQPVGTTVWHPGAQPHPFLRPALDLKQADAIAAMQAWVNTRRGHNGAPPLDEE